ncbi:MAG TPA: hypothetical protein VIL36_17295, partial [Acidimicrobiales bacterium]
LTDGIFEGHAGTERLGMEGLAGLVHDLRARPNPGPGSGSDGDRGGDAGHGAERLLDALVTSTRELNGGDLDDDLALLWVGARE